MKQTSQRSLLFRQNVNRTEAEWVHFLDGYRKALIEFDMKKFGDDWHTAEDIVEEIFLNIVREPRITALRPQDSFRHVLKLDGDRYAEQNSAGLAERKESAL